MTTSVVLNCRAGFENECAVEITERAAALGVAGYCKAKPDSAYVVFVPTTAETVEPLMSALPWHDLVFARQLFCAADLLTDLPTRDRLSPLLAAVEDMPVVREVWVEPPASDAGKALANFCRKFARPAEQALARQGWLAPAAEHRAHWFFPSATACYPGWVAIDWAAPWYMGIPRLKLPRHAPSRSVLKLEEALATLLTPAERERLVQPGMTAVDLGAAPGGWSWLLARNHLRVTAVDNGALDPAVEAAGAVEHRTADGFRYRPSRPVDWMVCDMVDQPRKVARLAARWLAEGACRQTVFNLKLPMKRRYPEVQHCIGLIQDTLASTPYRLRLKQLYHDREEVTGLLVAR